MATQRDLQTAVSTTYYLATGRWPKASQPIPELAKLGRALDDESMPKPARGQRFADTIGHKRGPMSPEHRAKISAGLHRFNATRKASAVVFEN